jgi:hypothetical protein
VEVAYGLTEQQGKALDPEVEDKIGKLWLPDSPVKVVELHRDIADKARRFIREAMIKDWSLKPADAIHLATAAYMEAIEFHTYDGELTKFAEIPAQTSRAYSDGRRSAFLIRRVKFPRPYTLSCIFSMLGSRNFPSS